ncbi:Uncharacterized protein ABC855_g3956 [[Candida] zeylanoides]
MATTSARMHRKRKLEDAERVHSTLVLVEGARAPPPEPKVADDDKVMRALNKLGGSGAHGAVTSVGGNGANGAVTLVVGPSEARYIEGAATRLHDAFGVTVESGAPQQGAADHLITLHGDAASVARAALLVAFELAARVNPVVGVLTLRSAYSLSIEVSDPASLRAVGVPSGCSLDCGPTSAHLRGDFAWLFRCLVAAGAGALASRAPVSATGTYGAPQLWHRHAANDQVLAASTARLLNHIYS